jgi:hypothetical protein
VRRAAAALARRAAALVCPAAALVCPAAALVCRAAAPMVRRAAAAMVRRAAAAMVRRATAAATLPSSCRSLLHLLFSSFIRLPPPFLRPAAPSSKAIASYYTGTVQEFDLFHFTSAQGSFMVMVLFRKLLHNFREFFQVLS